MNKRYRVYIIAFAVVSFTCGTSVIAQESKQFPRDDQCVVCHQDLELFPEDFNENDIHLQRGLSCAGCHGGDPSAEDQYAAMNPRKGYIGIPAKNARVNLCGKCHSNVEIMRNYQPRIATDQLQQYYTSVHGTRYRNGDGKVADCVDCHSAHAILAAADPRSTVHPFNVPAMCSKCHGNGDYMRSYFLSVDQLRQYEGSVHGVALLQKHDVAAPACNDCHGNHGAMPPGAESVSHVCGMCHANTMQYFATSPMGEEFQHIEFHACESCHGYHDIKPATDEMIGVGGGAICVECHSSGDRGYEVAKKISDYINSLAELIASAEEKSLEVQRKGMDDVEIGFTLQEANQSLIKSRSILHTFTVDQVREIVDEGNARANEAIVLAESEIKEHRTRRYGLGAATLVITLLIVGLFFKIREMSAENRQDD